MIRRKPISVAVVSLAFLWFLCIATLAQSANATLSGTVRDDTGGVLPGVEVTITNTDRGTSRKTVTDDEGRYNVSELVPGNYEVAASLMGFETAVHNEIGLTVGRHAVLDPQLYHETGRDDDARKIEDELLKRLALADPDHPILAQLDRTKQLVSLESAE